MYQPWEGWSTELAELRQFDTGATRDLDDNKHDYEGFISPLVIREFGRYMHQHRFQRDGSIRDSDNWQRGIPEEAYVKSLMRHFIDVWTLHRGYKTVDFDGQEVDPKDALCGIIFNASGLLHSIMIEEENTTELEPDFPPTQFFEKARRPLRPRGTLPPHYKTL